MVSTLLPLRSYQKEALEELERIMKEGEYNRLAVVLPTGGGKTVCFAHYAARFLAENPSKRVLILVHTDELADQTRKQLHRHAPHLEIGTVKASKNETRADVIVGSVQTLARAGRRAQVREVGLIVVDECDLAAAPSYRAILDHFGAFDGRCAAAGFTATLYRADGKSLSHIWQAVAYERDISWMIRRKYLIPPKGKAIAVPDLNLAKVKSTKADFREGELGEALSESLAPQVVAQKTKELASERKILAFFPTVASGYVFAQAFEDAGMPARVIHGGMSTQERKETLAWHRRGTVLVNCMILTVGYDDPEVDAIVMGRPTKSKRLYVQIVGRGLRVDPARPYEEQDCLLLDVVGGAAMHDLRSLTDLSEKEIEPDPEGVKTLIDLEDELDAGEGVEEDAPSFYTGPVVVNDFDPLAAKSSKAWNRTKKGAFFLPAGKTEGYVFLVPDAEGYAVAWCSLRNTKSLYVCNGVPREICRCKREDGSKCEKRPGAMTEHRELPLEEAMSWAEDLAMDMGVSLAPNKSARWRRQEPTPGMIAKARAVGASLRMKTDAETGIEYVAMNGGEVSDAIDKMEASSRIDPIVAFFVKARQAA